MGKVTGFMEFERLSDGNLPVADRVKNYKEFHCISPMTKLNSKVHAAWIAASRFVPLAAQ